MKGKIAKLKVFEKLVRLTELTNIRHELKVVNCNPVFFFLKHRTSSSSEILKGGQGG